MRGTALAGEAAHHFGAPADLTEGALQQVGPPPLAVAERVAEVHDQGVEVLGQAPGGGLVAAVLELGDQDLQTQLAVLD